MPKRLLFVVLVLGAIVVERTYPGYLLYLAGAWLVVLAAVAVAWLLIKAISYFLPG